MPESEFVSFPVPPFFCRAEHAVGRIAEIYSPVMTCSHAGVRLSGGRKSKQLMTADQNISITERSGASVFHPELELMTVSYVTEINICQSSGAP
jgi:hypothetical protein